MTDRFKYLFIVNKTMHSQELEEYILSKKDDPFESIIKRATENQVQELSKYKSSNEDFKEGVKVKYDSSRFYPLGNLASLP